MTTPPQRFLDEAREAVPMCNGTTIDDCWSDEESAYICDLHSAITRFGEAAYNEAIEAAAGLIRTARCGNEGDLERRISALAVKEKLVQEHRSRGDHRNPNTTFGQRECTMRTVDVIRAYESERISRGKATEILTSWEYGFTREQVDWLLLRPPVPAIFPETP